ncbi:hypothetical protein ARB25_44 [Bacteroides phage ARB25]|nr:hypothetical protein ARB14_44 [Bacteroides phage ARB14]QIG63233.1 hypothetical protein ARB25_44 [Bacteroides phage ARB25]
MSDLQWIVKIPLSLLTDMKSLCFSKLHSILGFFAISECLHDFDIQFIQNLLYVAESSAILNSLIKIILENF